MSSMNASSTSVQEIFGELVSERILWTLVFAFAMGDALTTGYAIHFGLAPEANPVMRAVIETYGISGVFLFKIIYVAALRGIACEVRTPYHIVAIAIGLLGGGLILVNNMAVLLLVHGII